VQGLRFLATPFKFVPDWIMDGEHDRALRHLQTGMAMAQHSIRPMSDQFAHRHGHRHYMVKVIEEFIQTPQAPNLYWGINRSSTAIFRFSQAYAGDRLTLAYMLGDPRQLEERIPYS